jgi:hypothetical protein
MAFCSDHPRQIAIQERMDTSGVKWHAGTVNKAGYAVFFGFWGVVGKPIKLFRPKRVFLCPVKVKQARIKNRGWIDD